MLSICSAAGAGVVWDRACAALQPPVFMVRKAVEVMRRRRKCGIKCGVCGDPAPKELLFRAGIAYPIRAEITGHGVGAVRHCIFFFDGPFGGTIEVWDEPRLLKVWRDGESGIR